MKMNFVILSICVLLISCKNNDKKNQEINNNSTSKQASAEKVNYSMENKRDTIIVYFIEGISSEGAEAKTFYISDKIKKSEIGIAGAEGQVKVTYTFLDGEIDVTEKIYNYKAGVGSVKSESDIKLKKEITYKMNYNGDPIGKADPQRLDIFKKFKNVVPFELK